MTVSFSPNNVVVADTLRIELLQLSTLLIDTVSSELMEHRKELIKFAWHHLKSEDLVTKNWAYVNVCRFIEVRLRAVTQDPLYSCGCYTRLLAYPVRYGSPRHTTHQRRSSCKCTWLCCVHISQRAKSSFEPHLTS